MKLQKGVRVKVDVADANGDELYGEVLDPNYVGFAVLVRCDTPVDKRYCSTDSRDVMFLKSMLKVPLPGEK